MLNFVWFPKVLNNPIRRRRPLQFKLTHLLRRSLSSSAPRLCGLLAKLGQRSPDRY